MKESFILYTEQKEVIDLLTDEEAGKLFKAIFEYQTTSNVIELPNTLKLIFIPIKQALDRNNEKYTNVIERNRLNGLKGGRPRKPNGFKNNPKNPDGYFEKPRKPKKADNDNDNDNDNEPVYDSDSDSDSDSNSKHTEEWFNATNEKVKKLMDKYFDKNKEVD